jgi:hypothetical protein
MRDRDMRSRPSVAKIGRDFVYFKPRKERMVLNQEQLAYNVTWIMNWESSASYPEKIADKLIG